MRSIAVLVVAMSAATTQGVFAQTSVPPIQAPPASQSNVSSVVTNCMMTCNASAASCQTGCLVPNSLPSVSTGLPAPSSNPTANAACLSSCTSIQITCQTNCSRQ